MSPLTSGNPSIKRHESTRDKPPGALSPRALIRISVSVNLGRWEVNIVVVIPPIGKAFKLLGVSVGRAAGFRGEICPGQYSPGMAVWDRKQAQSDVLIVLEQCLRLCLLLLSP